MKALITGITGFVGGWLAEHLLAAGDSVLGCSQAGEWLPTSAAGAVRHIPLVRFSLSSGTTLADDQYRRIESFAPDCIYHLAGVARAHLCGPAEDVAATAWEVNVRGTQRVLDLAQRLTKRPRLLFVSSSYVYPAGTESDTPVDEQSPPAPRGGYGAGKLAAEQLLQRAAAADRLDLVIARAFQHTGPRQGASYMLPTWAWQCTRPGQGPIWTYNTHVRIDVTDVRDTVRAYRLLALKGLSGQTYNVGSGRPQITGEVLAELLKLVGTSRSIRSLHTIAKFDPIAHPGRLADCTGWRPQIPLEQTLLDTFLYWRDRRHRRDRQEPRL